MVLARGCLSAHPPSQFRVASQDSPLPLPSSSATVVSSSVAAWVAEEQEAEAEAEEEAHDVAIVVPWHGAKIEGKEPRSMSARR